jgi:hypothetical protein
LVQADAGGPALDVRLSSADKSTRPPDVAAPSLGLYLFRETAESSPQKLLERLSLAGPVELLPARPRRVRVDALSATDAVLLTRELTLSTDGKQLALGP